MRWTDFVTLFVFCKPIALLTLEWSCQMDWKGDILNYKNNPHMNNEWTHTLHVWKGKSKWKCSYSKHTPLVSTFKRLDDKRMPFYLNWNWSFHFPFLLDLCLWDVWGLRCNRNKWHMVMHKHIAIVCFMTDTIRKPLCANFVVHVCHHAMS